MTALLVGYRGKVHLESILGVAGSTAEESRWRVSPGPRMHLRAGLLGLRRFHTPGGSIVAKVYGRFKPDTEERDRWERIAATRDQEK